MMKLVFGALLASAAIAQDAPPAYDVRALEPILSKSWVEQGSCEAGEFATDWVIDTDGWAYQRLGQGGYTPLKALAFARGTLSFTDEVGIGRTETEFKLREDGALKLWSERFFEDPDGGSAPPMERVKDGKLVMGPDGEPLEGGSMETVALTPCPARTRLFAPEAVAALGGKWVDVAGGSCGKGTGTLAFDLERPVPRVARGGTDELASVDAYVLSIARDGAKWTVTEGSAFEASVHAFEAKADGTLVETSEGAAGPRTFKRCL